MTNQPSEFKVALNEVIAADIMAGIEAALLRAVRGRERRKLRKRDRVGKARV